MQGDLETWIATHDKGWTTGVTASDGGAYYASAGPIANKGFRADYIEIGEPTAKAAALYALAEKTGHRVCSDGARRGRCTVMWSTSSRKS